MSATLPAVMAETIQQRFSRSRIEADRAELAVAERLPPDLDYHEMVCDRSDWDGISLELYGVTPVGREFTDEELDGVWAMGFTVLRLYYEGPGETAPHNGLSGRASGDFWRVKGHAPGACPCQKFRRPQADGDSGDSQGGGGQG